MASAAGQATLVSPSSEEYANIEYLLQVWAAPRPARRAVRMYTCALTMRPRPLKQLCLRKTTAKGLSVWSISNPHLTVQFERRTQDMLVVDCWVDINELEHENMVQVDNGALDCDWVVFVVWRVGLCAMWLFPCVCVCVCVDVRVRACFCVYVFACVRA